MNAKYTPVKVREWLAARSALDAVTGTDWTAERQRLTNAEESLLAEGWKNEETEDEMKKIASIDM